MQENPLRYPDQVCDPERGLSGNYKIAGLAIHIETRYSLVQDHCAEYRTEEIPAINVQCDQEDINDEREKAARLNEPDEDFLKRCPDSYIESLAVYRKIAEKMPYYDRFLFHGSAIAMDGKAYIFTAKSGTGKSTHARLWRELLGERAVMVNDDKPLIRVHENGAATVYGTPWDGKHHLSRNIAVPVEAICILERAPENHIREIAKAEAVPMLIQQAYRPAEPAALTKTLMLLDRMKVKLYRLGCNMDISAAELSYNTMKGESL